MQYLRCAICKRQLNNVIEDPFSDDCGGDCALCMLSVEAESGDYYTASRIAMGIARNLVTKAEIEHNKMRFNHG